jgi:hypothetical protein
MPVAAGARRPVSVLAVFRKIRGVAAASDWFRMTRTRTKNRTTMIPQEVGVWEQQNLEQR